MDPREFFDELKRRNVFTVAVAYAVGGWALAEGISQVFPVFDIPNSVVRLIVLFICSSFGDGMMRFFGSINTQRSTAGLRPFVLNFRRRFGASCGGECSHIRHRSATDKKSSSVAVKADDLFDPFDG